MNAQASTPEQYRAGLAHWSEYLGTGRNRSRYYVRPESAAGRES